MVAIDEKLKRMPRTVRVGAAAGGLSEFLDIQAAIDWCATQAVPAPSAATPYTVEIWPGVYDAVVVMAPHVNLRGIDKEACIIDVDHATLVTMAAGCSISNLTLDATSDATAIGTGIELNDAACSIEDVNIILHRSAGVYATGILESIGATARTINIRNVRIQMSDNTNERGIAILQAGKTVYIEESWVQGSDYGLAIGISGGAAIASTIYSSHNHFEATSASSRSVFNNGGTIRMNGDTIGKVDHTGAGITRENNGIITYKNIPLEYEVFAGMAVQDAITAAAADAPAPAAIAPYTVLIHPGIYDEVITCSTWVNLKGIGPKGAVVIQQTDATIITLATQVQLENFTVRLVTPSAARFLIFDNSVACTARMTDLVMEITTPGNFNIEVFRFQGAGNYAIERCSFNIGGTGICYGVANFTAGATIHLVNNDFVFINVNARHIRTNTAGTWTGGGNRWAGTCDMFNVDSATILFDGDRVDCSGGSTITGGSVCIKNGQQEYHVWAGMLIQHAITAAAADAPAPAATVPYAVLIHPGIYDEAVTCAAWVNLKGIGPKGSVVIYQNDANLLLINDCEIANLTLRLGTLAGARYLLYDNGTAYTCRMSDLVLEIVVPGAQVFNVFRLLGAGGDYIIERCSGNIGGTGNGQMLFVESNVHLIDNDFEMSSPHATAAHIFASTGSVVTGRGNRWAGATRFLRNVASVTLDNDAILCTGTWTNTGTVTLRNCAIEASVVAGNLGRVRLKNCSYRAIQRTGTGNIVDESPWLSEAPWKVQKWNWMTALASMDVGVRGTPADAGSGQVLLEVNTGGAADQEAVETNPEAAGSLGNEFTPARTPRFIGQIVVDNFHADADMFFGLRETLGNAIPNIAAEECAGFDWDGANFRAISSDGAGVGVATNLTTPTVNVQVQLEVIVLGGVQVEFYVDGVLVATHATAAGRPTAVLDWQHLLNNGAGGGAAADIDVTVRPGGVLECPS